MTDCLFSPVNTLLLLSYRIKCDVRQVVKPKTLSRITIAFAFCITKSYLYCTLNLDFQSPHANGNIVAFYVVINIPAYATYQTSSCTKPFSQTCRPPIPTELLSRYHLAFFSMVVGFSRLYHMFLHLAMLQNSHIQW